MPAYRFGPFTLDRNAYRLFRGPDPLTLPPKAIDLLFLLVSRPGTLVTKDDILRAVWPDVAVTDNAITQVVSDLRQAIQDSSQSPKYVQTVPRRGYRFVAPVETIELASAPPGDTTRHPSQPIERRIAAAPARSIAVVDFTNVSGDAAVAWLGAGIAETVTSGLRAIGGMTVFDRLAGGAIGPATDLTSLSGAPTWLVVGSFQRMGDQLRITARVVESASRAAIAQAKADGPLDDVFRLQDAIVAQLAAGLQLQETASAPERPLVRETSSLDAYRAVTIGRLKLEALDPDQVPEAIAAFEEAIALDPAYALAHVGLAHARFWQFQATRACLRPDRDALEAAIAHARRAIDLQPTLAEAHSALGFFLASADRAADGLAAARRAIELEPATWRHQFRLGMTAWGGERLRWLEAAVTQFPMLAYAYAGMAMVHVARGRLDDADRVLQTGLVYADRPGASPTRFPASGLHWLAGAVRCAQGDAAGARRGFEQELSSSGSRLYAAEYARDACEGLGYLCLDAGDAAGAAAAFTRSLERFPDHPRSLIGLASALRRVEGPASSRAADAEAHARRAIDELRREDRRSEAELSAAVSRVSTGDISGAIDGLREWIDAAPPGSAGWIVMVEPALRPLRADAGAQPLREVLARRAE